MKYVMIKAMKDGSSFKVPIIFPKLLVHADVARYISAMFTQQYGYDSAEPISAGEYNAERGTCSGRSETLRLDSDPEDSRLIAISDYYTDIETAMRVQKP